MASAERECYVQQTTSQLIQEGQRASSEDKYRTVCRDAQARAVLHLQVYRPARVAAQ